MTAPISLAPDRMIPPAPERHVVAYNGSLQGAHPLYAFEGSGLGCSRRVHAVSVVLDDREAGRHADRAVEFLRLHGIEARSHPVDSTLTAAEVLLRKVVDLDAGLLVMSACGQPVLREFFLDSATPTMLKESPVPVFCRH